jgi:CubicO group peptidase (beta-lactamase class C family)
MNWSRSLNPAVLVFSVCALSLRADPVGDLLQTELQKHHVPGLACKIIQAGQPDKNYFLGTANLEWQTPVTADTVFEIGSISKQFAAAAILLLVEDGKISLDDHISKFFTNAPASWSAITVRHLLTHTSGLKNYDKLEGFELRQQLTPAQFIDKLAVHPLNFTPGASWAYCNSAFNLLGYIVENVSGKTYWDFLQTRIFKPLQMTHTTIREPSQIIPHRAAGYVYTTNHLYLNRDYDLTDLFAAGAIVSTVDDLARWDAAITSDLLLKKSARELWWTPATLADGTPVRTGKDAQAGSYGFAWFIRTLEGRRNIGHTGITSGFSAANEFYPDDQLTVIILANTDEGVFSGELAKRVARLLFLPARK